MRLADLDPKWLTFEGRRVGFIFRCPLTQAHPHRWWQTCFVESFPTLKSLKRGGVGDWHWARNSQAGIIGACAPEVGDNWQGCKPEHKWVIKGGIANATFETLSVTPSLDGSRGGLWHGHITDGAIVGGL
jgi:hypothetical protein